MKKVLIVLGVLVVIVSMLFFETRNSLVSMKEDVKMHQAQIETTLQRRSDLIPNLVATVKVMQSMKRKFSQKLLMQGLNLQEVLKVEI